VGARAQPADGSRVHSTETAAGACSATGRTTLEPAVADDDDDLEDDAPAGPGRRYLTRAGAERMHAELLRLLNTERPRVTAEVSAAAAQGDRSENAEYIYGKKRLREIDRRLNYLAKRLDSAVLVDPKGQRGDKVFFGATVELLDESGARSTYVIVGEDETDSASGRISWRSPVGRALLGKRAGDVVVVRRPAGEVELEVLSVRYGG
jgi:transcription elongation factor GreB